MNEEVILLLGSNLGDRVEILERARWELYTEFGEPLRKSELYETEAWGKEDQNPFINQVVSYATDLRPMRILETILGIEQRLGRKRFEKWGPRTIDIDILLYSNLIYESKVLQIPHPQLQNRKFALAPLMEIYPDLVHPELEKTITQLYDELKDPLKVKKL